MASLEVGELTHRDPESAVSLLNGDVLEARIGEVLGEIGQRDDRAKECTLFTTATALDSRIVTKLENGTPVRTADGRRVYRFDRRNAVAGADAVDDFAPEKSRTLVTAARATAAFPVAFDPVPETRELRKRHDRSVTDIAAHDAAPVMLVDGGVLDNAPFEPLLRALRERPTTEPYERVLLYVTPSVEAELAPSESPKLLKTLTSVLAATREPDERLDVDALKQTFELMGVTSAQPHSVITAHLSGSPDGVAAQDLSTAAESLLDLYRHGRTESLQRKLERCCTLRSPLQPPGDVHLSPAHVPGGTPGSLVVNGEWRWGAPTADHLLRWWGRALSNLHGEERIGRSRFDCVEALAVVGASQREVTAIRAELIAAIEDVDPGKDRAGTIRDPRLGTLRALYEKHGDAAESGDRCGEGGGGRDRS